MFDDVDDKDDDDDDGREDDASTIGECRRIRTLSSSTGRSTCFSPPPPSLPPPAQSLLPVAELLLQRNLKVACFSHH